MQSSKFGMTLLIGFGSIFVILIGLLIGLEVTTKTEYDDFEHIDSYQRILDQDEEEYIVYWYGENCSHCAAIKDQVISFANKNDEKIKVYFINSAVASGVPNLQHPTNESISMQGTPTMIVVKNGAVADMVVGSEDIPNLITLINAGKYNIIN